MNRLLKIFSIVYNIFVIYIGKKYIENKKVINMLGQNIDK